MVTRGSVRVREGEDGTEREGREGRGMVWSGRVGVGSN
jgi:hypothetical protein